MSASDTSQRGATTADARAAPRHLQAFPLFGAPNTHASSRWASQPTRRPRRGRPPVLESTQRHIEPLDTSTETTQQETMPHAVTPFTQHEEREEVLVEEMEEAQVQTSTPAPQRTPPTNHLRSEETAAPSTVPSLTNASSRPSLVSSQAEAAVTSAAHYVDNGLVTSHLSSHGTAAGNNTSLNNNNSNNNTSTPVNGVTHATTLSPSGMTAEEVIGAVFRRVYNDKLRESVQGITHTLAIDLPEDHVFRQLMADGLTAQYCKVRLGEVVENFLFATQAQQYYALTAELARKELDAMALQQRLERVEAELRLQTYNNTAHSRTSSGDVTKGEGQSAANPMADEVARRELMTILEETTRQSELERGGRTVTELQELITLVQREPRYKAKHEYVTDVLTGLFRTVRDFGHYVDASLESVEALRADLATTTTNTTKDDSTAAVVGALVTSTPPSTSLGMSTAERISATRAQLRKTLDALQEAQLQSVRVVDRLAHRTQEQSSDTARLRSTIDALREAQVSALEAHRSETQTLRSELDACRRELVECARRAQDAERAAADAKAAQERQTEQNIVTKSRQEEEEMEEERRQLRMRAETAERTVGELRAELTFLHAHVDKQQQENEKGSDATHVALLAAQEEAARWQYTVRVAQVECLVAKMELHESRLQGLYSESDNIKRALLERDGYQAAGQVQQRAMQTMQETLRQAELTRQLADTALLERNVAERDLVDFLHALLRTMHDDARATCVVDDIEIDDRDNIHRVEEMAGRVESTALVPVSEEPSVASDKESEKRARRQGGHIRRSHMSSETTTSATHETQSLTRRPTSSAGLAAALQAAYDALQQRYKAQVTQCTALRRQLAQQDTLVHRVRQSGSALETQWHEANVELDKLRAELSEVRENSAALETRLQRQALLLKTTQDERDALRTQWLALNEDYVTLERRNSELHARCTDKEYENTRLLGLLHAAPPTRTSSERVSNAGANVGGSREVHIDPTL